MLYRTTRNLYQRLLNREEWQERMARRSLFRRYVAPGELAFDVGAHRGHYAETLREIGARVVAVEANPDLAAEIRRHFPGLVVEETAVGPEEGEAVLRLGADTNHSTLSEEWAAKVSDRWVGTTRVPVTTLDALIARHGTPAFLKIDVEGYEAEVLAGLRTPVRTIMFEYLAELPDVTRSVLERLEKIGPYRFRLVGSEAWVDADGVLGALEPEGSGDVLASLDASGTLR